MSASYTTAEKLAEIDRELEQRRRVYPRLIAKGNLTHGEMARRINLLEAIRRDYAALIEKDPRAAGLLL